MTDTRHFVIPGEPQGKGRPRSTHLGRVYTPGRTRAYEKMVQYYYNACCHYEPFGRDVPLVITIKATFAPPKRTPKKRLRDMLLNLIFPTKKPDWDNIGKIICDSCNGIAWHDDSQITTAHVYKRYGTESVVEVWISKEDV